MSDTLNVAKTIKYSKCNQNSLILEKTYYGKGKGEKRIYQFSGGLNTTPGGQDTTPHWSKSSSVKDICPLKVCWGEKRGKNSYFSPQK